MAESPAAQAFFNDLTIQIEKTIDIDTLLKLSEQARPPTIEAILFPKSEQRKTVRIAVARDKAFSFYYQDNLDLLEAWGAELVPFSPLSDNNLPCDIDGIYIGGGFPEMYARELSYNASMLSSITEAASNDIPIYGECGGLMYLGRSLRDFDGYTHKMVGTLLLDSQLDNTTLTLGYRTVRALNDGPLLKTSETVRAHEFHRSKLEREPGSEAAYLVLDQDRREGFKKGNVFASYIHIHFGSRPGLAQRFIQFCQKNKEN